MKKRFNIRIALGRHMYVYRCETLHAFAVLSVANGKMLVNLVDSVTQVADLLQPAAGAFVMRRPIGAFELYEPDLQADVVRVLLADPSAPDRADVERRAKAYWADIASDFAATGDAPRRAAIQIPSAAESLA